MILFFSSVLFAAVVFAPCSHGQGLVKETTNGSVALQPWLIGLTAVTVFLLLMFVASLINRIFFSKKKDDQNEMENLEAIHSVRPNVYENTAMDPEEGSSEAKM